SARTISGQAPTVHGGLSGTGTGPGRNGPRRPMPPPAGVATLATGSRRGLVRQGKCDRGRWLDPVAADLVPAGGTTVGAPVIVRTAGVPAEVLARLRCSRSYALARAVDRRQAWLRANGEALSDKLHAVIGGVPPGAARPALVGLRRAGFHVPPPTGREGNPVRGAGRHQDQPVQHVHQQRHRYLDG